MAKPEYYACGCCDHWHSPDWNGDCREDEARFSTTQLEAMHGQDGWEEVPQPGCKLTLGEMEYNLWKAKDARKHARSAAAGARKHARSAAAVGG